jgi:hypothetical protein
MTALFGLDDFLAETDNDLGMSLATEDEIMGIISDVSGLAAGDACRRAFASRLKNSKGTKNSGIISSHNLTTVAEFEKRAHQLPTDIRKALARRELKVIDDNIYTIRAMSGLAQMELMANSDTKAAGVSNINHRKLEANKWFLLTGIILQSAVSATPSAGAFGIAASEILNGEFSLDCGSRVVVPRTSCILFDTTGRTNLIRGYYKLENPKWLTPEAEIVPELRLPIATAANTAIAIILLGASVQKT